MTDQDHKTDKAASERRSVLRKREANEAAPQGETQTAGEGGVRRTRRRSPTRPIPCQRPQRTKHQEAPCQRPQRAKTTTRLR